MRTEQISIFDILAEMESKRIVAVSMLDNQEYETQPIEPWMRNLLPDGEYYFTLGGMYTMVLCAVRKKPSKDLSFCYYKVGDTIYMATGVGIDKDAEEEPEEDSCEYS